MGVRVRVATLLKFAGLYTATRESRARIKACPEIGSVRAGGGTADNLCSSDQGDRCSSGTRGKLGFFQYLTKTGFFYGLFGD